MLGPLFGLGPNSGRKKPLIICISTKKTVSIYTVGERGREREANPFLWPATVNLICDQVPERPKKKRREKREREVRLLIDIN